MRLTKFITLISIFLLINTTSCHKYYIRHKQQKALKEAEKKQQKLDEERLRQYEEAVKKNASHQSKRTKKMMKQTYKRADMYNNKKKEFFVKRWFKRKSKTVQSTPKQE